MVYIVGAGCGDYDLITLRGKRLLESCSVVIYDSLIDERLLDFAPEHAEKICVGKRAGQHSETQERINALLVEKALQDKTVVRLKGGDPFVFGRGGEEIQELQRHNIPYETVPGISSCIAVPELAGIPVTHRRLSRSFHVITARTAEGSADFHKYAHLDGTLVFLMGLERMEEITNSLINADMPADTPVAVISNGGTPHQRVIRGALGNITERVREAQLTAPAVIVIGKTAEFEFASQQTKPLEGVSVTLTGTKRFVQKLSHILIKHGAEVIALPSLRVIKYEDNPLLDTALNEIDRYRWLALTSANGAEIFFERMARLGLDARCLSNTKIAVIGAGTAAYLKERGIIADIMPDRYTAADLGKALVKAANPNDRILLARAEKGSEVLTRILNDCKMAYDDIKTYDVAGDVIESNINTDYIVFASASGVKAFFDGGGIIAKNTRVICIGETTAAALAKYDAEDYIVADESSAEGIAKILENEYEKI